VRVQVEAIACDGSWHSTLTFIQKQITSFYFIFLLKSVKGTRIIRTYRANFYFIFAGIIFSLIYNDTKTSMWFGISIIGFCFAVNNNVMNSETPNLILKWLSKVSL